MNGWCDMSLPSRAIYYFRNDVVKQEPIDCGWFCNRGSVVTIMKNLNPPEEWTGVYLYGIFYTKEEIELVVKMNDVLDDFWIKRGL